MALDQATTRPPRVRRALRGRHRLTPEQVEETQCARLMHTMLRCAGRDGLAEVSIGQLVKEAEISRRTIYELFGGREALFACVLDPALEHVAGVGVAAFEGADGDWAGGVRAAVVAVAAELHADPDLARLCLIEALAAGPAARAVRARRFAPLAEIARRGAIAPGRLPGVERVPAAAVLGGAQELLAAHFAAGDAADAEELAEAAAHVVALVVGTYLGPEVARPHADAVRRELPSALRGAEPELPAELDGLALTRLQHEFLAHVVADPGSTSRALSVAIEVSSDAQASRILHLLDDARLVTPVRNGRGLAWMPTPLGTVALRALDRPPEPAWLLAAAHAHRHRVVRAA